MQQDQIALTHGMASIEADVKLHYVTAGAELLVPRAAHWIAEENPEALVAGLRDFVKQR